MKADERAVLKHFKWPEKKADAMREAAIEYRSLQILEKEISSYSDDSTIPYCMALKRMASLLDKYDTEKQYQGRFFLRLCACSQTVSFKFVHFLLVLQ